MKTVFSAIQNIIGRKRWDRNTIFDVSQIGNLLFRPQHHHHP